MSLNSTQQIREKGAKLMSKGKSFKKEKKLHHRLQRRRSKKGLAPSYNRFGGGWSA